MFEIIKLIQIKRNERNDAAMEILLNLATRFIDFFFGKFFDSGKMGTHKLLICLIYAFLSLPIYLIIDNYSGKPIEKILMQINCIKKIVVKDSIVLDSVKEDTEKTLLNSEECIKLLREHLDEKSKRSETTAVGGFPQ